MSAAGAMFLHQEQQQPHDTAAAAARPSPASGDSEMQQGLASPPSSDAMEVGMDSQQGAFSQMLGSSSAAVAAPAAASSSTNPSPSQSPAPFTSFAAAPVASRPSPDFLSGLDHPMASSPVAANPAAAANFQLSAPIVAPAPVQPPQPPAVVILPLELPAMRELPPIKLGRTPKERTLYEQLGDLYSLIVTTEHIETAYVRDAISEQAYTATCSKLIAQYKTLRESMGDNAPDLDVFCREYSLECRAAENRFKVGIPATVIHGDAGNASSGGGGGKLEVAVFHAVQHFITTMDSLKLNMRAVDELHPTLSELMDSINKVPNLPPQHESKVKTLAWLTTLHQMKAHEELTDEQARQMSFDLDSAYSSFHRFVKGQ